MVERAIEDTVTRERELLRDPPTTAKAWGALARVVACRKLAGRSPSGHDRRSGFGLWRAVERDVRG